MKIFLAFTIILLALAACATPPLQPPEPAATAVPPASMPNPASLYCEQKGNKLEIVTAADGSQSGVCIFPDGSACDEWAYFRGECGTATPSGPKPIATVAATIQASADTVENGSGGYMPPGTTEEISDWWGVIKHTQPGSQYDDYFERQDLGQAIYFGIDSIDPAVKSQIETLRDSGKVVHLYGTLVSNAPDYNGSQIQVIHIKVD